MLDELFFVHKRVRANDVNGQCMVTYEILKIALLHCMEWCSSEKKKCNTLGDAYPKVNLSDVNGLEHLAWTIYDEVNMPGDQPALTGYNDWDCIAMGTLLHLIFCRQTDKEHFKPTTIASFNVKWA